MKPLLSGILMLPLTLRQELPRVYLHAELY